MHVVKCVSTRGKQTSGEDLFVCTNNFFLFFVLMLLHVRESCLRFKLLGRNPVLCSASNREDVERRFEGKLSKNMSGSLYEMVSRVMKALVNRKITVPGNFQG